MGSRISVHVYSEFIFKWKPAEVNSTLFNTPQRQKDVDNSALESAGTVNMYVSSVAADSMWDDTYSLAPSTIQPSGFLVYFSSLIRISWGVCCVCLSERVCSWRGMQMHAWDACHHSQDPFYFCSGGFGFSQRGKMQHPPPNRNTHSHFHSHTPTIPFISLPSLRLLEHVGPVCRSNPRRCVRLDGLSENDTNGSLYRNIPDVFYCSLQLFLSTVTKL